MIEPGLFDMIMRLRSSGVSDTKVLRAMEQVKRSHFVKTGLVPKSYDETSLPIACGQTLPAPLTIAIMLQTLAAQSEDKILHIGTGSGYTSAVLAQYTKRVYGIDRFRTLVEMAEEAIKPFAYNVVLRHGDGRYGWKGQAPFERILISCDVNTLPAGLQEQLTTNGCLVAVVKGQLVRCEKAGGRLVTKNILPLEISALQTGKSKSL